MSGESAILRGTRRCAMRKLYIVRLTKQERVELQSVVKKRKGTGQKVRRAQILLPADADGPHGSAERIAAADVCRTSTGERLRQRCVEPGGDAALNRVERQQPPVATLLTGDQEARSSATRLGPPPQGDTKRSGARAKQRPAASAERLLGPSTGSGRRVRCPQGRGAGKLRKAVQADRARPRHGRTAWAVTARDALAHGCHGPTRHA